MGRLVIVLTTLFIILYINIFSFVPSSKEKSQFTEMPKTAEINENYGCTPETLSGSLVSGESLAIFDGQEVQIPEFAFVPQASNILGVSSEEKWIEVDLSDQKLTAWNGSDKFLETPISSGLPWTPTPTGEFRIWIKLRYTKMEGGQGKYYYNLPNVPYVMYFSNSSVPSWKGYGIHGAYWHNQFGTPRSHGCVNLPPDVAGQLYNWATPDLGNSVWGTKSTASNPGTRIVIHE